MADQRVRYRGSIGLFRLPVAEAAKLQMDRVALALPVFARFPIANEKLRQQDAAATQRTATPSALSSFDFGIEA